MRTITVGVLAMMIWLSTRATAAQTSNDVQIQLGLYTLSQDGGERPMNMWATTGPVSIGKPLAWTYSLGKNCDAWTLGARDAGVDDNTTAAWKVEVTPTKVTGTAVRFRLRWVRANGIRQQLDRLSLAAPTAASGAEDVELTLRPGQSWPIDSVKLPAGQMIHGEPCPATALIRVAVTNYPQADQEQRLLSTELWLIERLANGAEVQRSQPLTIRSVPNHTARFFFDSLVDGADTLDLYGTVLARLDNSAIALTLETRMRRKQAPPRWMGPHRVVNSEIRVTPGETVEIKLPALGESVGPFAQRILSIRVRTRQIR